MGIFNSKPTKSKNKYKRMSRRDDHAYPDPHPCLWEEIFYQSCQRKGHSTIRCTQSEPHRCTRQPTGQARWETVSPHFLLCPKCEAVREAKSRMDRHEARKFIKEYSHSYVRQPHPSLRMQMTGSGEIVGDGVPSIRSV